DAVDIAVRARRGVVDVDNIDAGPGLDRGRSAGIRTEDVDRIVAITEADEQRFHAAVADAREGRVAAPQAQTGDAVVRHDHRLSGVVLVIDVERVGAGLAGHGELAGDGVDVAVRSRRRAADIDRVRRAAGAGIDRRRRARVRAEHVDRVHPRAEPQVERLDARVSDAQGTVRAAGHAEAPDPRGVQEGRRGAGVVLVVDVEGVAVVVAVDDHKAGDAVHVLADGADLYRVAARAAVDRRGGAGQGLLGGEGVAAAEQVHREARPAVGAAGVVDADRHGVANDAHHATRHRHGHAVRAGRAIEDDRVGDRIAAEPDEDVIQDRRAAQRVRRDGVGTAGGEEVQALDVERIEGDAGNDQLEAIAAGRGADLGRVAVGGERAPGPAARVPPAVDRGVDPVPGPPEDGVVAGAGVDGAGPRPAGDGVGPAGAA